jgi:membrane-bound ClpP family serine protease
MLKTQIVGTAGGPDPDSPAGKAVAAAVEGGDSVEYKISTFAPEDEESFAALAGKIGVTDSILRPSGRAVIDNRVYTVEADGEYIEEGRGVIVTRVRGNRIIVKRV